ncbi:MAG: pilus assembly protein [Alphaproteobacteria bacterium]|nr:pilus assembly protein [Alphaproteobacteria bacterium]
MKVLFKSFLRSEKGSNLIEFAFVAPIFLTILIGLFDLGAMLIVQNSLDAGARAASRFGLTGASNGLPRDDAIRKEVLDTVDTYSGGIAKRANVIIAVEAYNDISSLDKPEPFDDVNTNGAYDVGEFYVDINGSGSWDEDQGTVGSFGAPGQAVKYTISYDWNSFLGLFGFQKKIHLIGTATIQNENF